MVTKGIICAGGLGTRLRPLTLVTNKHLLPLYDRCVIHYPIETMLECGIDHIIIVTGGPHAGHFLRALGNGKKLGIAHLEYTYQEEEGGIAQAIGLCKDFAAGEPVLVILGDNFTDTDLRPVVQKFERGAHIFLKTVPNPAEFGVPVFDDADPSRIVAIEEKPKEPKSEYAVTGFYLYDSRVFDFIRELRPSGRGELEVSDLNNRYAQLGELSWSELDGEWYDVGTSFDSLLHVSNLVAQKRRAGRKARK